MASIFTFDPDPPKVSSPWLAVSDGQMSTVPNQPGDGHQLTDFGIHAERLPASPVDRALRLEAEPQEGPTEYKLHLLLRPRRSLSATSTGRHVAGSQHSSKSQLSTSSTTPTVSEAPVSTSSPMASSNSSRQHRLEQLTTQLLWRLQQSSPHHSTSANNLILPAFPEAKPKLYAPERLSKLLPGLEESRGALYEIGVSDDGTLVGLTMDEMNESLNNLRAMAASLGCSTKILRMVCVGECEWLERVNDSDKGETRRRTGKLYVAEAYVKPELRSSQAVQDDSQNAQAPKGRMLQTVNDNSMQDMLPALPLKDVREQIRVTLTGATTCGKSSLLGTLSTSTLDNGRGKSRLSLLKHRHEIASGITSSVSQELVGYHDETINESSCAAVINFATENVSSWTDIHAASASGRLALLSDSAGHPRYRRTTVRGLVGCAPHWVFLCIAANEDASVLSDQSVSSSPGDAESTFNGANAHISIAHLDLCLKLQVPLAVIITKLDLATKSGVRLVMSTLLTRLKDAGRRPEIVSSDGQTVTEADLQTISGEQSSRISRVTDMAERNPLEIVPIILTSAVKGSGIASVHALLHQLPIPTAEQDHNRHIQCSDVRLQGIPSPLFHIDELFNRPLGKTENSENAASNGSNAGTVLSGHLAVDTVSIGAELYLGPFSDAAAIAGGSEDTSAEASSNEVVDGFLTPRSFTDALLKVTSSPKLKSLPADREWRRVSVVSVRNLRMPVRSLLPDQVGTVGIQPMDAASHGSRRPLQIRKGMVLANGIPQPPSAQSFTASFDVADASSFVVGTVVVVYSASVRTSAKVVAVALEMPAAPEPRVEASHEPDANDAEDYAFGFEFDEEVADAGGNGALAADSEHADEPGESSEGNRAHVHAESILVTFRLVTYREWLGTGAKVLVMPGGGPGLHGGTERGVKGIGGLDGYVGRIVQTFG